MTTQPNRFLVDIFATYSTLATLPGVIFTGEISLRAGRPGSAESLQPYWPLHGRAVSSPLPCLWRRSGSQSQRRHGVILCMADGIIVHLFIAIHQWLTCLDQVLGADAP